MQPATLDIVQLPASNGTIAVKLTGKLSLETVNGFLQSLRPADCEKLILDMSDVSFLDSAGVAALAQLFVHRRGDSQKLALAALTAQGYATIHASGLVQLLPIFLTIQAASK